jgi:protein dithiol oxidoreductase (disulfide-forming)
MKRRSLMLFGLASLAGGRVSAATDNARFRIEGQYELVEPPQSTPDPERVQVLEFFWYGCPHCLHLEPHLNEWVTRKPDYVDFVRVPVVFRDSWLAHAKAFYTAEILGIIEPVHPALFDAIHKQRRAMDTATELEALFVEHGAKPEEFRRTFDSFAVQSKVRRAVMLTRQYGIEGVPAVTVNGKFRTSGSTAGSYPNLIKVVATLVEEEHREITASRNKRDGAT